MKVVRICITNGKEIKVRVHKANGDKPEALQLKGKKVRVRLRAKLHSGNDDTASVKRVPTFPTKVSMGYISRNGTGSANSEDWKYLYHIDEITPEILSEFLQSRQSGLVVRVLKDCSGGNGKNGRGSNRISKETCEPN